MLVHTMDCPSCGAECAAGARFCWSCGQPLRVPTEERRVVTVLFADLVGFTALSEQLDPEHVKRLVDQAFERLVRDVTAFGGRVDKIVGDAIVALFGAPVAHEDDAERAVRAALRMQETLGAYSEESGAGIRMRIGVNTGEVLVGALRAGGDYTAMGDVVNTASRLQTLAEPGEVLVGESTHGATDEVISYESRGALVARGREQPVNVWTAVSALLPPGYRPRRRGSPLVGRDGEMSILTNTVRVSITHGRGQVVVILGEAGVGKTRIANELAHVAADEHDVRLFGGRCVPYGEANPWWPIAEALRSGCGIARDEPLDRARGQTEAAVAAVCGDDDSAEHRAERTTVADGLLHLMGYEGPMRGLDGARARTEATQALLTFLEGAVRQGPVMVRLADLHWADQAVLDLIDEIATHLARHPFVFVATARRALQERWTPRAGRFNSLVLNLDPLDRSASGLLLDTLAGDLDEPTRSVLLDRSGGNPFYLEELVTLMGQHTAGAVAAGATPHAAVDAGLTDELPDTLRGLVAARIDGLSPEEQLVLEDASVWGSSGPLKVVDRIAEAMRGVADVSGIVQSMADKDVLVFDGVEWSFRSDLIREVAYARLTKRERLLRHVGIASYLERMASRHPDDGTIDTIARHYVEGARLARDLGPSAGPGDIVAQAVRWAVEAARRAEDDASWPLARRLYSQALDLIDPDDDALLDDRLRCLLGRSHVRTEQWDEAGARRDATDALALADVLQDPSARARSLLRLAAASARSGDFARSDVELHEALEIFDGLGDTNGRAEALRQRGMALLLRGDQRSAEEPISAALDAFRAIGDRRGEAWSLQNLAWIAFSDGRTKVAEEFIAASEVAFREVGDLGGLAWVQGLSAFVRFQQGDFRTAAELAARILRECERRGDRFGEGMMHLLRSNIELWTGHPVTAAASAAQAVASFRSAGDLSDTIGFEQALALGGRAEVMAGNVAKGRHLINEAVRAGDGPGSAFAAAVGYLTDVQVGQPESLLDLPGDSWFDGAGDVASRSAEQLACRAVALAQTGREEEGLVLAREAADISPDGGYELAALALVAAACGLPDDARDACGRLGDLARSTYLDRLTAELAVAVSDLGPVGDAALLAARDELGTGEDLVAVALVQLADDVRTRVVGGVPGDPGLVSERLLEELGLGDTRWSDLFRTAVRHAADRSAGSLDGVPG
jgi:class 3 adenylate cyclase/tetratricopeptide (TPR) repeat protein